MTDVAADGSAGGSAPKGTGITWGLRPIEGGPSEVPLTPGCPQELVPGVIRILAPNAGFFTGPGTNSYVVGHGKVVIVDPGSSDDSHLAAIRSAIDGREVVAVFVTHHHDDHAPGAIELANELEVPLLAHPGKLDPDLPLGGGDSLASLEIEAVALYTPGHSSDHLCLYFPGRKLLFSGDHVMGGSTVVISPPDGDMAEYLKSIEMLRRLNLETIMPGHGQAIYRPAQFLDWYLAHRLEREKQILTALEDRPGTIRGIVPVIYDDVPESAYQVAAMSVWAHLIKLEREGRVAMVNGDGIDSTWCVIQ